MKKKYQSLILISLIFLLLFLNYSTVEAGFSIGSLVASFLAKGADFIIRFIAGALSVFLAILTVLANIVGFIFDWVKSPNFVSFSYTKPCAFDAANNVKISGNCNPVISVGLSVTQGFVNLILVVFLIVIALAMALQYRQYGSRKTLIKLIVVALLVNFAPVLVGLIVDACNIIMNHFLNGLPTASSFIGTLQQEFKGYASNLISYSGPALEGAHMFMHVIIGILFYIALVFVFGIFTIIFIYRYIAIWILTILAPLAIVCWVLPKTKNFFDKWWSQLIEWSIVGIPASFFLFLAFSVRSLLNKVFTLSAEETASQGLRSDTIGLISTIFPHFVVLIFLLIGCIFSLRSSAMGAKSTLDIGKKVGKAVGWGLAAGTAATVAYAPKRAAQIVKTEMGQIRQFYAFKREMGTPRIEAATKTIGDYWRYRAKPAIPKSWAEVKSAGRGAIKALGSLAAGAVVVGGKKFGAEFKKQLRKKEEKKKEEKKKEEKKKEEKKKEGEKPQTTQT